MVLGEAMRLVGVAMECLGVAVLLGGAMLVTLRAALAARRDPARAYEECRTNLGRVILLGLEFLVIADIVGTVVVEPSFESLGVLGLLVLIRTFLSFALQVEVDGRLPWRAAEAGKVDARRLA